MGKCVNGEVILNAAEREWFTVLRQRLAEIEGQVNQLKVTLGSYIKDVAVDHELDVEKQAYQLSADGIKIIAGSEIKSEVKAD
jgi:hypothetical protein